MSEKRLPKYGEALNKNLSPITIWALSFGCVVGSGAFYMPGTTFLPISGPLGTLIGITLSAIIMLIIGVNYSFMINHYPDAGGSFTYARENMGYDHGFVCSWFMALVYISIAWANATAIPIMLRHLLGNLFQFGFHYKLAGNDVYFGEAMLSVLAIILFGFVCYRSSQLTGLLMTICSVVMVLGIVIGFIVSLFHIIVSGVSLTPMFSPKVHAFSGILSIVALAPWAFVGFEAVSHATEEYDFSPKKISKIIVLSIIISAFCYIALSVIAVAFRPEGYSNWNDYINNLDNLEGLEHVPVLNTIYNLLGKTGLFLFCLTIFGALISGVLGHTYALSRLMLSMSRQNMLPSWFGSSDGNHMPINLIPFLVIISIPMPFFGRGIMGWMVDISTIGAAIAYMYTSHVAFRIAWEESNRFVVTTGALGMASSMLFFLFSLLPSFSSIAALSTGAYLSLVVWSILGFLFFQYVFHKNKESRYGRSTVVWAMLIFLVFFAATVWTNQISTQTTNDVKEKLKSYQSSEFAVNDIEFDETKEAEYDQLLDAQLHRINASQTRSNIIQIIMVMGALIVIFSLYASIIKKQQSAAEELVKTKNDFLANMSHEIRTPINTILGMDEMILRETQEENSKKYANDIYIAGNMLVSLVNDVLDFSKIDSGKLELFEDEYDFSDMLNYLSTDINNRAKAKGLIFDVNIDKSFPQQLYGDSTRLRQIFLNLLTNAVKYTETGRISLNITGEKVDDDHISMKASIIDTGTGIKEEDLNRLFNSFDRINDRRNITASGAGLGLNIVKSLLDLMHGNLDVESVYDVGSNFTFTVCQKVIDWTPIGEQNQVLDIKKSDKRSYQTHFTAPSARILLADDTEMNLMVVKNLLKNTQIQIDTAKDGALALEMTRQHEYDMLLIDHRMPIMDGVQMLTNLRNSMDNYNRFKPCVSITANAGDGAREEYLNLGFDDYLAKPVTGQSLEQILLTYLPPNKIKAE